MQVEFEVGANLRIDQVVVGHQDYVGIILLHLLVKVRTDLLFFPQVEELLNVKRLVGRQPCFIVWIRNFNFVTTFTVGILRTPTTVLLRFYLVITVFNTFVPWFSGRELFLISINGLLLITYGCCATCHTQGVTLHMIKVVRR